MLLLFTFYTNPSCLCFLEYKYSKYAILIHAVFKKCYFECAISTDAVLNGHPKSGIK